MPAINAVTLQAKSSELAAIRALPYVVAANPDQERRGGPVDTVAVTDFANGLSTWDLDAINVTDFGRQPPGRIRRHGRVRGRARHRPPRTPGARTSPRNGSPSSTRRASAAAAARVGFVSTQPNKWESDTDSHGTHVTSTILGLQPARHPVNGVAPMATVIPVKVLNQNGSGWSSVVARGITYVADLKAGTRWPITPWSST